jgi:peptidoglycan/LPS O-acetylase OafA/YrhL
LVTEPFMKFLIIIIGVAISIISAYIMYIFIEKPSKDWAKKIKY